MSAQKKKNKNPAPSAAKKPVPTADSIKRAQLKEYFWLALFFYALIPANLILSSGAGLDPSWQLSVNMAVQKQMVFGQDYIFTYGPLGIFQIKYGVATSKWGILFFEMARAICVLYVVRHFLRPGNYPVAPSLLFLITIILLNAWVVESFFTPLFVCLIIGYLKDKNMIFLWIAWVISIISFYLKVNYGIILSGILYGSIAIAFFRKEIPIGKAAGLIAGHMAVIYLLSFLLHVHIPGYVISSLHLINAFNDAMYVPIEFSNSYFTMALITVALFVLGFLLSYKYYIQNFVAVFGYLVCGFLLFLLFKNGYVRADSHVFSFFNTSPVVFGISWLYADRKDKRNWGYLTCAAVLISLYAFTKTPTPLFDNEKVHVWTKEIIKKDYFKEILTDVSDKNSISENRTSKLPASITEVVGKSTVDIMPWEIAQIYYSELNYNPRPVVQSYSAYDEYLDNKNYEKYISESAPEYIIYANFSIDGRYPFWDESKTKRAILTHYEVVDPDSLFTSKPFYDENYYVNKYADVKESIMLKKFNSGYEHYSQYGAKEGRFVSQHVERLSEKFRNNIYVLLKKRKQPLQLSVTKTTEIEMEMGKDYPIENSGGLQFLYADVEYDLKGKLQRLLFQPPPLEVVLTFENNTSAKFRAVVPILKTGVQISHLVQDTYFAALYFSKQGKLNDKIKSIRFVSESGFNPTIKARIEEMQITK